MPSPARTAETPVTLAVPGADLCLDFANTRYWRGSPEPTEQLATPADFHGTPWEPRSAAPELGEHTDEILAELAMAAFTD